LLAGSGLAFAVSLGLQLVGNDQMRRRCVTGAPAPSEGKVAVPIGPCLAEHPGIIGTGVAAGLGALASIGLATGAGWGLAARGPGTRRQQVLRTLGATLVGVGLAGFAGAGLASVTGSGCASEDLDCHARQRGSDLAVRNVTTLLLASGGGLLAATRRDRVRVQPMRLAHGAGLSLTVRLP